MRKKISAVLALCIALASLMPLAGCGGNTTSSDDKITLTLWTKTDEDANSYDKELSKRMEEALVKQFPDVNFEFIVPPSGTDYRQEYDKALMAGTAPSIYHKFSYTDIPSRIENGTIADITDFVENWDLKKEGKILDVFDDAISKDGKWYALPYQAYTIATTVNKKTVEAAGGDLNDLPATWDEFTEFGLKIADPSIPRFAYSMIGMDWCAWPFTAWVWSAGGEMIRENGDGTYSIAFNEDPGVDAAMYLNDLIWKYQMTQKDVLADLGDVWKQLYNGSACFSWLNMNDLKNEELAEYGLTTNDFVDIPMPVKDASIPRPALAGGEVITFNPKLSEEELKTALEVANWLYFSDDRMQAMCDDLKELGYTDLNIPGRVDWYEKKLEANEQLTDEQKEMHAKLSENAKAEPYCPHWSEIKSELVAPLQKIYITSGMTREEVKKLLDECADKIYSLYPDVFVKK